VTEPVQVLFVCLGNICRSPTAHGVFAHQVEAAGLKKRILIDSAGTGDWHVGRPPDTRAQRAASGRGYDLSRLRARQVKPADFERFHYILPMDAQNLADLERMRPDWYAGHLGLFLEFAGNAEYREVPDPYYGSIRGFELVLDLIEDAARNLLQHIQDAHSPGAPNKLPGGALGR